MSILIYFATIFWSLFPNLIHVFQGGDNFINKVNATNLVINGDFSDGTTGWSFPVNGIITIFDGKLLFPGYTTNFQIRQNGILIANDKYYLSFYSDGNNSPSFNIYDGNNYLISWNVLVNGNISFIFTSTSTDFRPTILANTGSNSFFDNFFLINVNEMILNGVKNDSGISFSDLTDLEIQEQLDLWIIEYGNLDFKVIYDNTADSWFDTGFVEKTSERDFLDYLGYFVWLLTPPIILFATLDLLRRVI